MSQESEDQYLELPTPTGEVIRVLRRSHPQARRLRLTATVFHMERVGLDAVPLVILLSYMVGAEGGLNIMKIIIAREFVGDVAVP